MHTKDWYTNVECALVDAMDGDTVTVAPNADGAIVVEGEGTYTIDINGAPAPSMGTVTASYNGSVANPSVRQGNLGEPQKSAAGTEMFPNIPEGWATFSIQGVTDGG